MFRKLQLPLLLCFLLGFWSCRQQASLMKRHYTKGYYVSHAKTKKGTEAVAARHASHLSPAKKTVPAFPKAEGESLPLKKQEPEGRVTVKSSGPAATAKPGPAIVSNKRSAADVLPKLIHRPLPLAQPMVKTFSPLKKSLRADPAAREALSLLWILILVLLIVYVIGLLANSFGLGWVFHILAVIILILLILWLLRII